MRPIVPRLQWPLTAALLLLAPSAWAHGVDLAEGILIALVLVGLAGLLGLGAVAWTVALVLRVRRGAGERERRRCRSMGVVCSLLAFATLVAFVLTWESADAVKLLPCALVLGATGLVALRVVRTAEAVSAPR